MCTNLYRGYGYSGAFCENMSAKVQWLKTHLDEKIQLVCEPDMICEKCPNLKDGDFCANGDNHVCEKDKSLLQELHLVENEFYTYSELMQAADEYLSEETAHVDNSNYFTKFGTIQINRSCNKKYGADKIDEIISRQLEKEPE